MQVWSIPPVSPHPSENSATCAAHKHTHTPATNKKRGPWIIHCHRLIINPIEQPACRWLPGSATNWRGKKEASVVSENDCSQSCGWRTGGFIEKPILRLHWSSWEQQHLKSEPPAGENDKRETKKRRKCYKIMQMQPWIRISNTKICHKEDDVMWAKQI